MQEHQKADAKTQGANRPTIPAGTYYFVVLPQTFTKGFTIEAYQAGNATDKPNYTRAFDGKITLPRSRVLNVGEMAPDPFNGHDYVDLGIEVDGYKVLWATMNVGATTPEGYGDYFAWGETAPKTDYSWDNYAWGTSSALTKYTATDGKTVLDLDDDAAHVKWGGDWVMPTVAECEALCDNTTNAWTTNYNGTGINGFLFTSTKDTSKSIFLPAAGYCMGTNKMAASSTGIYLSSSFKVEETGEHSYALNFSNSYGGNLQPTYANYRNYGRSVRPVIRMAK